MDYCRKGRAHGESKNDKDKNEFQTMREILKMGEKNEKMAL